MTFISKHLSGFVLTILTTKLVLGATKQVQKEFCSWETFKPECEGNDVIVMQAAKYGLMERNRCVLEDLGFIGCSSDQMGFFDARCSGRNSCMVDIHSKELKNKIQSCPEAYLDATYICQTVQPMSDGSCAGSKDVIARTVPSYISSSFSLSTKCGYGNNPFVLQAQQGQGINLTLMDFSWNQRSQFQVDQGCNSVYGHIMTLDNEVINICGKSERVTHLHFSSSSEVQILLQEEAMKEFSFIIKYEAVGCADMVPPKDSWMKKNGNDLTIGCHTSSKSWKMKCVGNHWIGVTENCTQDFQAQEVPLKKKQEFGGTHVSAIAVGCLAIIICCVTVTLGIYFVKRYKIKMKSNLHISPDVQLLPTSRQCTIMRPVHANSQINSSGTTTGQSTMMLGRPYPNNGLNHADSESATYFVLEKPAEYTNSVSNNC